MRAKKFEWASPKSVFMVDIHTIIAGHRPRKNLRKRDRETNHSKNQNHPTTSEIPDLFFDEILVHFRLSRVEVIVLMYLYRKVWCRPNRYREYGISQLIGHAEMAKQMNRPIEEIYTALRKLEELDFIMAIRSGQYFVRKYFSKENDSKFGLFYNEFDS